MIDYQNSKAKLNVKSLLMSLFFAGLSQFAISQVADSTSYYLKGNIAVTNNGISFIPSFSLGDPATIVNLYMGKDKGRLSFEPELRYGLSGKPWAVIFIWRYKLIRGDKFNFTVGTHLPYLIFRTTSVIDNSGNKSDIIQTQRYFPVVEAFPNYNVSKKVNIGVYYMNGYGQEDNTPKHTNFISLRSTFTNFKLIKEYYVKGMLQSYYLKLDDRDGFYTALNLTLARQKFPISISSLINKKIDSDISGKNFDWNVSLNYTFNTNFFIKH